MWIRDLFLDTYLIQHLCMIVMWVDLSNKDRLRAYYYYLNYSY